MGLSDSGLDDELEALARGVIGAAIEVHKLIGPGLPELVYKKALSVELRLRGIPHEVEAQIPVVYKGVAVGRGAIDILVAQRLIVELKSVDSLVDIHREQVIAYLAATRLQLGLLLNFNVSLMSDGIRRVIKSSHA